MEIEFFDFEDRWIRRTRTSARLLTVARRLVRSDWVAEGGKTGAYP